MLNSSAGFQQHISPSSPPAPPHGSEGPALRTALLSTAPESGNHTTEPGILLLFLGYFYSSEPSLPPCSCRRQQTWSSTGSGANSTSILTFKTSSKKSSIQAIHVFHSKSLATQCTTAIISTFEEHMGLCAIRKALG